MRRSQGRTEGGVMAACHSFRQDQVPEASTCLLCLVTCHASTLGPWFLSHLHFCRYLAWKAGRRLILPGLPGSLDQSLTHERHSPLSDELIKYSNAEMKRPGK